MSNNNQDTDERLNRLIQVINKEGTHPDFPKKGILFRQVTLECPAQGNCQVSDRAFSFSFYRDMFPLFQKPELVDDLVDLMCEKVSPVLTNDTVIIGLDARGFILGPLVARQLRVPFVPLRKKGKLPGKVSSVSYALEYGEDTLEIQSASLKEATKCVVIDDLLATGGTLEAATRLIALCKCQVTLILTLMELTPLNGRSKLNNLPFTSLIKYD